MLHVLFKVEVGRTFTIAAQVQRLSEGCTNRTIHFSLSFTLMCCSADCWGLILAYDFSHWSFSTTPGPLCQQVSRSPLAPSTSSFILPASSQESLEYKKGTQISEPKVSRVLASKVSSTRKLQRAHDKHTGTLPVQDMPGKIPLQKPPLCSLEGRS